MDIVSVREETLCPRLEAEIEPLLRRHWKETDHFRDGTMAPDWPLYERAWELGLMTLVVARAKDRLVGYEAYVIAPNPHRIGWTDAKQELIYVRPEYRGHHVASNMMKLSEKVLKARNVDAMFQSVPEHHDYSAILLRLGFAPVEKLYTKRL